MTEIILNEHAARVVSEPAGPRSLRFPTGRRVTRLVPLE